MRLARLLSALALVMLCVGAPQPAAAVDCPPAGMVVAGSYEAQPAPGNTHYAYETGVLSGKGTCIQTRTWVDAWGPNPEAVAAPSTVSVVSDGLGVTQGALLLVAGVGIGIGVAVLAMRRGWLLVRRFVA